MKEKKIMNFDVLSFFISGMGIMTPGMAGINQGMTNMSLQSPSSSGPVIGPAMQMRPGMGE